MLHNEIRVIDHGLCGLVLGSLYRLPMGPRPMAGAALAGFTLGSVEGEVQKILLYASGTTYQDHMWEKHQELQLENKLASEKNRERSKKFVSDSWKKDAEE